MSSMLFRNHNLQKNDVWQVMCLTLADALAPLDALAFWSAVTLLLELADPDVL